MKTSTIAKKDFQGSTMHLFWKLGICQTGAEFRRMAPLIALNGVPVPLEIPEGDFQDTELISVSYIHNGYTFWQIQLKD